MTCSFKFCRGSGKCFLEGVSPCSAHGAGEEAESVAGDDISGNMRRMGLSRMGFVSSKLISPADPEPKRKAMSNSR